MAENKVGIVEQDAHNESHKVAIAGAGGIGLLLAEKLANQGYEVVLYNREPSTDNVNKVAENEKREAKVVEINESSTGNITFTHNLSEVRDCEVVHYIQGGQRKAGESRNAVFSKNEPTLEKDIPTILNNNPKAMIVNTANPVDHMTRRIAEIAEQHLVGSENRIIGMGSSLDTTRLHDITEETLKGKDITGGYVIGGHDNTMVPIFSDMKINGESALDFLERFQHKEYKYNTTQKEVVEKDTTTKDDDKVITIKGLKGLITQKIKDRGAAIIQEGNGSDVEGPSVELLKMTDALTGKAEPYCTPCISFSVPHNKINDARHGSELNEIGKNGAKVTEDTFRKGLGRTTEENLNVSSSRANLQQEYNELVPKQPEINSVA